MTELVDVALSVITSAPVAAAVVWAAKGAMTTRIRESIRAEYDAKLETHKATLAGETAWAIESLKADLQRTATEHQVRFTRLHERQAETIAEPYRRIAIAYRKGYAFASVFDSTAEPSKLAKAQRALDALQSVHTYSRVGKAKWGRVLLRAFGRPPG